MLNIKVEVAQMQQLTVKKLKAKYAEVFGEQTKTNNKAWLIKRIAWRLQMLQEGDISERARRRAAEIANDADLRLKPPTLPASTDAEDRTITRPARIKSDDRLPPPGSLLTREYKGESYQVLILSDGFEYQGKHYRSLSAVAKTITGSHCNGYQFFKLNQNGENT